MVVVNGGFSRFWLGVVGGRSLKRINYNSMILKVRNHSH